MLTFNLTNYVKILYAWGNSWFRVVKSLSLRSSWETQATWGQLGEDTPISHCLASMHCVTKEYRISVVRSYDFFKREAVNLYFYLNLLILKHCQNMKCKRSHCITWICYVWVILVRYEVRERKHFYFTNEQKFSPQYSERGKIKTINNNFSPG